MKKLITVAVTAIIITATILWVYARADVIDAPAEPKPISETKR